MKKCPHCDGDLMDSVIKCVHCGKDVNAPVQVIPGQPAPPGAPPAPGAPGAPGAPPGATPGTPAAPGTSTSPTTPPSAAAPAQAAANPAVAAPPTAAAAASMTPEFKQEPYFHMKTEPIRTDLSTSAAGGYVGSAGSGSGMASIAALCMLIGGVMAVAGAFMEWITISVGAVELPRAAREAGMDLDVLAVSFKGTSDFIGWLLVLDGAVAVLLGGSFFLSEQRKGGDTSQLKKGLVPILFLVGITVWLWFQYSGDANQIADITQLGLGLEASEAVSSAVQVSNGPGLWLSAIGAGLALLGVVFSFMASGPKVTAIAPGGTKWAGGPAPSSPRPGGSPR